MNQLTTTGDTQEDISNLIDALNSFSDSDSVSTVLNMVAYGAVSVTIPDMEGSVATGSFLHNLGYAPAFLINLVINDTFFYNVPLIYAGYVYDTSPLGEYPYAQVDCYADEENIYIKWINTPNPTGDRVSGTANFSFYLFSQPINSGT